MTLIFTTLQRLGKLSEASEAIAKVEGVEVVEESPCSSQLSSPCFTQLFHSLEHVSELGIGPRSDPDFRPRRRMAPMMPRVSSVT